jgi:hypothetical protein
MGNVFNMNGGGGGIKLTSISITTPPTKTAYKAGESFSTAGMVVTATYSNNATVQATGYTYDTSALAAGTTSITITYSEGGVTRTATQAITVTKTALTVPTQSGTLTYSGSAQSPTWSNYDSTKMTLGGTTSGTNAGNYSATFTIKDTSLYEWADGTTTAKTVTWEIGKATPTFSLSATSVTLNSSTTSTTVTVTTNSDGAISVSSNATSVATASVSGKTVTIKSVNSTTGSATVTVSVAASTNYLAVGGTVSVTAQFVTIYGAAWAGTSSTALTRTDASANFSDPVPYVSGAASYGSPFDNLMPWSGMKRVTDSEAGELVAIPKFWYKLTMSGSSLSIQVADGAVDGFSVSPAHMDRGDGKGERDTVYIGRYHCASTYKSTTGTAPKASITRSSLRTSIHNLGSTIWSADIAMRFTIWLLYIVEFADWDSQTKIGYGCGNNSATENMGASDSMPYHTGTMQTSRTTYGVGVQYRYIEGLWDNVRDWMDGCYYTSSGLNIILNPANFSDSSGGTLLGLPTSGYPSALSVGTSPFPMFYPTTSSGSNTTYVPDSWGFSGSNPCLYVGGCYYRYLFYGLFYVGYDGVSDADASIGGRLQKLP